MPYYNSLTFFMDALKKQYEKFSIDPDKAVVISVGTSNSRHGWDFLVTVKSDSIETNLLIPMYADCKDKEN